VFHPEELAEALDEKTEKVEYMLLIAQRPLSLETPSTSDRDDEAVIGDFVEDKDSPDPEETASQTLLIEKIKRILHTLPPREVRVLQLRFGLLDGKSYTLQQVGDKMGITRERVRQIEAQVKNRIRDHPEARQIYEDSVRG
jgi:RNA polymerase primary sigma factor